MRCVAVASVATGHPKVNVHLPQEPAYVNGRVWDDLKMQLDDVSQHLQLLRSRVSSWASAHAQWENKSCVRVVVVHVLGLSCSRAESVIIRGCRCNVGLIWFVLIVPMM